MDFSPITDPRDIPRFDPGNDQWGYMVLCSGLLRQEGIQLSSMLAGRGVVWRDKTPIHLVGWERNLALGWPGESQGIASNDGYDGTPERHWMQKRHKRLLILDAREFMAYALESFNDG